MSIRTALSSLPSWPAVAIAPVLILAVGYMSYGPSYRECTRLAEARDGFGAAVERAAREGNGRLRLERAVAVADWDQVRILQGEKPSGGPLLDCPFGWDLTEIERRDMMTKGRLGILAFARVGEVVGFIEFRSDRIRFEVGEETLKRGDAVFAAEAPTDAGGPIILRPATQP